MDLMKLLQERPSKAQALRFSRWVGEERARFDALLELWLNCPDKRLRQRAAWIFSHVAESHPQWLPAWQDELIVHLQSQDLHDAEKRNILKVLASFAGPSEQLGLLAQYCFERLADPGEPVAVRVHAMQVLFELGRAEPVLHEELREVLRMHIEGGSAGFRSRARKLLSQMDGAKGTTKG